MMPTSGTITRLASLASCQPSGVGAGGCQRQAAGADLACDPAGKLAADASGLARRGQRLARYARGEGALQRAFLADLAHRAADPVDEARRRRLLMRAQPRQQVGAGGEAFAVAEDSCQPGPGALCQVGQHLVGRSVAIADEDEAGGQVLRLDAVHAQVGLQGIVEQRQAREMEALELRERNDAVVRVGDARLGVHRVQERAQGRLLAGRDRRDHQEVVLRRHLRT